MRDGLWVANLTFVNIENCQFQLQFLSTLRIDFQNQVVFWKPHAWVFIATVC